MLKIKTKNKFSLLPLILSVFALQKSIEGSGINLVSLYDLLPNHPEIQYFKCHEQQHFNYNPFPLSIFPDLQPHQGLWAETFVTIIPNGQAYSHHGFIQYNGQIIKEFFSQVGPIVAHTNYAQEEKPKKPPVIFHGRVAVITRIFANAFSHWTYDILGRLALLEILNIEYDWLYIPHHLPFMKEMLTAWGIDPKKIIEPYDQNSYIQADQLIVPSIPYRRLPEPNSTFYEDSGLASYFTPWLIEFLRNKFLPLVQHKNHTYSDKVFISRQRAGVRKIINEDEIFALFEPFGFKRYCLEDLSFLEQVLLFKQATAIVAAHGAGQTHLVFCDSQTVMIEIFQERSDLTYWYLCQKLPLRYFYIPTCTFKYLLGHQDTVINPSIIQDFIQIHPEIFNKGRVCCSH